MNNKLFIQLKKYYLKMLEQQFIEHLINRKIILQLKRFHWIIKMKWKYGKL